jgi:hypothetical protein
MIEMEVASAKAPGLPHLALRTLSARSVWRSWQGESSWTTKVRTLTGQPVATHSTSLIHLDQCFSTFF